MMFRYHLSPCRVFTVLFTVFPLLSITSLWWFIYSWKFVLLFPFTYFALSSLPPWQPPVCSLYLWVYFCFVLLWFISLSVISARSIHVVTNGKISFFFYGWIILQGFALGFSKHFFNIWEKLKWHTIGNARMELRWEVQWERNVFYGSLVYRWYLTWESGWDPSEVSVGRDST